MTHFQVRTVSFREGIFQMGWFNHQLANFLLMKGVDFLHCFDLDIDLQRGIARESQATLNHFAGLKSAVFFVDEGNHGNL